MELNELLEIAKQERTAQTPVQIHCCVAAGCLSADSLAVKQSLEAVAETGLKDKVQISGVGCMHLCCLEPLVCISENTLYKKVTAVDAPAIISELDGGETTMQRGDLTAPFFSQQVSIVLENSGKIDPERIESYIAADGYPALEHVLQEMQPAQVIDAIARSSLRGRGGAGYPTGLKWATVAKAKGERK